MVVMLVFSDGSLAFVMPVFQLRYYRKMVL